MQQPFLKGIHVYLRSLQISDLDGHYINWLNDAEVCQFNSHHVFPYTREAATNYITQVNSSQAQIVLAVCLPSIKGEADQHIGNISLQRINLIARQAEFAILMGDKTQWGKGYAKEAAALICQHGFKALNLNRIHCGTSEDNRAMQKLAAYLGMSEEGRRRQAHYKNGQYVDIIEYGVLSNEFPHSPAAKALYDRALVTSS